jgi:hypothetical protein
MDELPSIQNGTGGWFTQAKNQDHHRKSQRKSCRGGSHSCFLDDAHPGEWRDEKWEERETTIVIIRKRGVTDKKLLGEVPKCVFLRQEVGGEVPECVFLRVFS